MEKRKTQFVYRKTSRAEQITHTDMTRHSMTFIIHMLTTQNTDKYDDENQIDQYKRTRPTKLIQITSYQIALKTKPKNVNFLVILLQNIMTIIYTLFVFIPGKYFDKWIVSPFSCVSFNIIYLKCYTSSTVSLRQQMNDGLSYETLVKGQC